MNSEVIVVGGGAAGLGAALAAARTGAKTLLIERYGFFGGMTTAGLVHHWDPIRLMGLRGIALELYQGLKSRGLLLDFDQDSDEMPFALWQGGATFDPEEHKALVRELLLDAGVDILLHTLVVGTRCQGQSVRQLIAYNKSGKIEIEGSLFIDATGDGDVAALSDVPFEKATPDQAMAPTLCFRIGGVDKEKMFAYLEADPTEIGVHPKIGQYIRQPRKSAIIQGFRKCIARAQKNGDLPLEFAEMGLGMSQGPRNEFHVNCTHANRVDCVSGLDISRAEMEERAKIPLLMRFINKYLPGFEKAYLIQTGTQLGVRETRRIRGEYYLVLKDLTEKRKFEDAMVEGEWGHTDIHSADGTEWSFVLIPGPYQIPYGSMIARGFNNLAMVGRCISCDREVLGSIRVQPVCTAMGEAMGTAAAVAVEAGGDFQTVSVQEVQQQLRRNGFRI